MFPLILPRTRHGITKFIYRIIIAHYLENIKYFLSRVVKSSVFKPRVIICVPSGVTEVEEMAVEEAARNAGAKGIGCLWGFRDEAELKAAGAHCLANAPLDILSLVSEER